MEGYDCEFVPHPEPRYECPICLLVLREPFQTKCGHRFCRDCILKSLRHSCSRCPVDNEPLKETDVFPDNFAKREILNFTIKCTNDKNGCDKTVPLGKLQNHLEECPFTLIPCPHKCDIIMQRCDVDKHITSVCENRNIKCEHCHSDMQAKLLEKHVTVCSKAAVECPHCKEKKVRCEMELHIQNECQQVEIHCPFYHLGCTNSMVRSMVDTHLMVAGSSHMKQLCHAVTVLAQKLGIAHLISQTSPKNLHENLNLIHSISSEPITDSQDWNNKRYPVNSTTDELSISSETLLAQLHALSLEQNRRENEKITTVYSGTKKVPIDSLKNGKHRFTNPEYQSRDMVDYNPLRNSAKSPVCRLYQSQSSPGTSSSLGTSTLVNHNSNSSNPLIEDQMMECYGQINSDVMNMIQEISSRFEEREAALQQKFEDLTNRFTAAEQANSGLMKTVKDLEQRMVETSAKFYSGDFYWSIGNFSLYQLKLEAGESSMLHSPPFYTSPWGYKMCVRANIDKCSSNENQLSLFVHFMRGKNDAFLTWPFSGKIIMSVVDQNPDPSKRENIKETLEADPNLAAFQRPSTPRNHKGFGYIGFLSITALGNGTLLMDDTLVVRTQVVSNSD